jgi:hypothetical protein
MASPGTFLPTLSSTHLVSTRITELRLRQLATSSQLPGLAIDDRGRVLGLAPNLERKLYSLGFFARANHGDLATVNTIGAVAAGISADISGMARDP